MQIRVAIVEDNTAFREAFVQMLARTGDMLLIGAAHDYASGLKLLQSAPADVLLVDIDLPGGSGIGIISQANTLWPHCPCMVLTTFSDMHTVMQAVAAGALGYLLKHASETELLGGIRGMASNGSAINPQIAREILKTIAQASPKNNAVAETKLDGNAVPELSEREIEILRLIQRGYRNKEIAKELSLSTESVKTYIKRFFEKLRVNNRIKAIAAGKRSGILS
jgi:DNA-binding NarL/FixJ family response regulator